MTSAGVVQHGEWLRCTLACAARMRVCCACKFRVDLQPWSSARLEIGLDGGGCMSNTPNLCATFVCLAQLGTQRCGALPRLCSPGGPAQPRRRQAHACVSRALRGCVAQRHDAWPHSPQSRIMHAPFPFLASGVCGGWSRHCITCHLMRTVVPIRVHLHGSHDRLVSSLRI